MRKELINDPKNNASDTGKARRREVFEVLRRQEE